VANDNKFLGLSRHNLQEAKLRVLSEIANFRADNRDFKRQIARLQDRISTTRSCMAEKDYELAQLEAALLDEKVVVFPGRAVEVVPIPVPANTEVDRKGVAKAG
jgi:hypothetical protein